MGLLTRYFNAWVSRGAYKRGLRRALEQKNSPHGFLGFAGDAMGLPGFKEREKGYRDVVRQVTFAHIYSAAFRSAKLHKSQKPRSSKPSNPRTLQNAPHPHQVPPKSSHTPKSPKRRKRGPKKI